MWLFHVLVRFEATLLFLCIATSSISAADDFVTNDCYWTGCNYGGCPKFHTESQSSRSGCRWYQGNKERCCKNKCFGDDPDNTVPYWTGSKRGGCPDGFDELDSRHCGFAEYYTEKCQRRAECFGSLSQSDENAGCYWKNGANSCPSSDIEHDSAQNCNGIGDIEKCCPHIVNDPIYGQSTNALDLRKPCAGFFTECSDGCIRTGCGCRRDYKQERLPASSSLSTNKSNWMNNKCARCLLSDFVLPGTHHGLLESGAGPSLDVPLFDIAQIASPQEQLQAGIRFFDVRLAEKNGDVRVSHGGVYGRLEDLMYVLKSFLQGPGSTETLVVWARFQAPTIGFGDYEACSASAFDSIINEFFPSIVAIPESWDVPLEDVAGKIVFCGDGTSTYTSLACDGSFDNTRTNYPPDVIDKHQAWIRNNRGGAQNMKVSEAIVSMSPSDVLDVCDESRQIQSPLYNDLKEIGEECNFYVDAWLEKDGSILVSQNIGAVMVDFVPQAVIDKVIAANDFIMNT